VTDKRVSAQGALTEYDVYYEGGTVDRFWVAPAGLGMVESRRVKVSKRYRTHEGARRAMLALYDEQARGSS
jgi:hypothetical protein